MSVTRLLALVTFFALCAGLAVAQSQQSDSSNLVVFQGAASIDSSHTIGDQLQVGSESQAGSTRPSTEDRSLLVRAGEGWQSPGRTTLSFPLSPESDRTCYFIRDYVVIRDSPHSDSVHRDGSFTCVPGSRFRVYTTGR